MEIDLDGVAPNPISQNGCLILQSHRVVLTKSCWTTSFQISLTSYHVWRLIVSIISLNVNFWPFFNNSSSTGLGWVVIASCRDTPDVNAQLFTFSNGSVIKSAQGSFLISFFIYFFVCWFCHQPQIQECVSELSLAVTLFRPLNAVTLAATGSFCGSFISFSLHTSWTSQVTMLLGLKYMPFWDPN